MNKNLIHFLYTSIDSYMLLWTFGSYSIQAPFTRNNKMIRYCPDSIKHILTVSFKHPHATALLLRFFTFPLSSRLAALREYKMHFLGLFRLGFGVISSGLILSIDFFGMPNIKAIFLGSLITSGAISKRIFAKKKNKKK